MRKIPVTVIIVTKNESRRIEKCLACLTDFSEVIVMDSFSKDGTQAIAGDLGAHVIDFRWSGLYPKKRQWTLDHIKPRHDHVFFVDADEYVTPELAAEIAALDWRCDGYFVKGRYTLDDKLLRFGLTNNKLALFNRHKVHFPVVDDLGIPGMGEIEGHYQPVLKEPGGKISQLKNALVHDAYNKNWTARHERYAMWEAGMNQRNAWPTEDSGFRKILKSVFRAMPLRPTAAFVHCYIFKLGFLDGVRGFKFARSRAVYYRMISRASKNLAAAGVPSMKPLAADK